MIDRSIVGLEPGDEVLRQVGVLCLLPNLAPVRMVIVTSRRTGRWVFPKGKIDAGMTPPQAAAQEALEEAGVVGMPDPEPVGTYKTLKIRPPTFWRVEVDLYSMQIDEIRDVWDEAGERIRRFVTLDEARDLLDEPELLILAEKALADTVRGD